MIYFRNKDQQDTLFSISLLICFNNHPLHVSNRLGSLLYMQKMVYFCLPQQAEVAQGMPGRLRPRIFFTFLHYKGGRSSAKRTGRLYPQEKSLALTFRG